MDENPYKSPEYIEETESIWDRITNNYRWDTFCDCFSATIMVTVVAGLTSLFMWLVTGHCYWQPALTIWALGIAIMNMLLIVAHEFLG